MPDFKPFQCLCQDSLEWFFGLQRQRGGVHENPNAVKILSLESLNLFAKFVIRKFSRVPVGLANMGELCELLPKRRCTSGRCCKD